MKLPNSMENLLMKMLGINRKKLLDKHKYALEAASERLHEARCLEEFNEEFNGKLHDAMSCIFHIIVEQVNSIESERHKALTRYRSLCDTFLLIFMTLHEKTIREEHNLE